MSNEIFHEELELSYNLSVMDGVPVVDRHEETPQSQAQDNSNDHVRIKKAAFYGLVSFFVFALAAAIMPSCFLFKKARMAGKHAGFNGKGGHSNPSFRV